MLINLTHPRSSEYARKLTFHFISFKPLITKYIDLHFILTENLSPGLQEQDLYQTEKSEQEFQQSLEDEKSKKMIVESLHHEGLLLSESSTRVEPLMPAGRIYNIPKNKRKIILDQFLLSTKNFYSNYSRTESLLIVPDLENPSEIVPVSIWAKYKDKIEAFERILEFSQYFHQETDIKESKELKKYKFGDYPFVRYLFEEQFDYSGFREDEEHSKGLDSDTIKINIVRFIEKIEKKLRVSKKKEFANTFFYSGYDIEVLTFELNSLKGIKAKFEIRPNGERVIYLVYTAQNVIDPLDVEHLFRKYGEELISGKNEIEIDVEDQEKLEKIMSFGKEPAEIFELYLEDKRKEEKTQVK
jgi:hypothetical protein